MNTTLSLLFLVSWSVLSTEAVGESRSVSKGTFSRTGKGYSPDQVEVMRRMSPPADEKKGGPSVEPTPALSNTTNVAISSNTSFRSIYGNRGGRYWDGRFGKQRQRRNEGTGIIISGSGDSFIISGNGTYSELRGSFGGISRSTSKSISTGTPFLGSTSATEQNRASIERSSPTERVQRK